jgi:serine protease
MRLLFLCALALPASSFGSVLWNNGPMATGELNTNGVAAPSGNQWSELQTAAGSFNTSISFGVNYTLTGSTGPNRLSDDFTITGLPWAISEIVVYGFQTNMSPTSGTFTTGVVQIWNGRPGDAGSQVVAGDLTTNRLTSAEFTGIWRVGRGGSTLNRPIMAATLSLPVTLSTGNYWIEYGMTGPLAGSVQSPLVTVPGALTVPEANARFYTSHQYWNLVDSNSQVPLAVPFEVRGEVVPEPATLAAIGLGFAGVLVRRRRKQA